MSPKQGTLVSHPKQRIDWRLKSIKMEGENAKMINAGFQIALETGCDYTDHGMTEVWRISDYVRLKKLGLPVSGIEVENYIDNTVSYLPERDLFDFMKRNDVHPNWMEEVPG